KKKKKKIGAEGGGRNIDHNLERRCTFQCWWGRRVRGSAYKARTQSTGYGRSRIRRSAAFPGCGAPWIAGL
ncbi:MULTISPECIES: hypothetical protein, partial [Streptomyces]|uniref:hypothetical protein n=1 Tax=Streptomyces TaxID=1883 RepID=UPI001ADEF18B